MNSASQALVYALLAPLLPTDRTLLKDADLIEVLGLDPLDLVLLAIKLEELEPENGTFPLAILKHARSVGDLVAIVDVWSRAGAGPDTERSPLSTPAPPH
jgi:hypothetical protein